MALQETLYGAMVLAMPHMGQAAGQGGSYLIRLGGKNNEGHESYMFDRVGAGTMGARQRSDGIDGAGGSYVESSELLEAHFPVRIERYELVPDTGGPGKTRGSESVRRDYRWLGTDGYIRPRIPRLTHAPWGVDGGDPGSNATLVLNPGQGDSQTISPKGATPLKTGDVVSVTLASGGGWGNRLERDPARALHDYLEGVESAQRARDVYGIVIDEQSRTIDEKATRKLRHALRENGATLI